MLNRFFSYFNNIVGNDNQAQVLAMIETELRDERFSTLTENDKAKIKDDLMNNFDKIDAHRGKDVVFFLGQTGSGKSTLINYMLGHRLVKISGGMEHSLDILQDDKSARIPIAKIGQDDETETMLVNLYSPPDTGPENGGWYYSDCAGFNSTASRFSVDGATILAATNIIAVRISMQLASSAKLMLTMSKWEVLYLNKRILSEKDDYKLQSVINHFDVLSPESVIVVVTHVSRKNNDTNINDYKNFFTRTYDAMNNDHSNDPYKNDPSTSLYDRFKLLRILKSTPHLVMADYDAKETKIHLIDAVWGADRLDQAHISFRHDANDSMRYK